MTSHNHHITAAAFIQQPVARVYVESVLKAHLAAHHIQPKQTELKSRLRILHTIFSFILQHFLLTPPPP